MRVKCIDCLYYPTVANEYGSPLKGRIATPAEAWDALETVISCGHSDDSSDNEPEVVDDPPLKKKRIVGTFGQGSAESKETNI